MDIKLRSGRVIQANRGILGLSLDPEELETLAHGYDGELPDWWDGNGEVPPTFTADEKEELAQMMIRRWAEFGGLGPSDRLLRALRFVREGHEVSNLRPDNRAKLLAILTGEG